MNPRLTLELLVRRHGWPVMLAAALPIAGILLPLVTRLLPAAPAAIVLPTDGGRQLEAHQRAFLAVLIPRGELEARQRDVLDAAARHNLGAGRVDYAYENNAAGRFGVATLQLPLRGSYPDLRAFLAETLRAQPALAVGDLAIRRDAAGNGIEAQLRLDFHTTPLAEAGR